MSTEALQETLARLADQWERDGIPCGCGHTLDEHNGLGCYARLSYEPLVKCDCPQTDDRHDGELAAVILRALAAEGAPCSGDQPLCETHGSPWVERGRCHAASEILWDCFICGGRFPYGHGHPSPASPVVAPSATDEEA